MKDFYLQQQNLGVLIFDLQGEQLVALNQKAEQLLKAEKVKVQKTGLRFLLPDSIKLNAFNLNEPCKIWEGLLQFQHNQIFLDCFGDGKFIYTTLIKIPTSSPNHEHLLPALRLIAGGFEIDGVVTDLNGNLFQFSENFAHSLGYKFFELHGKNLLTLIPENQRLIWLSLLKMIKNENTVLPLMQVHFKSKSGQLKSLLLNNSILRDKAGNPVGFTTICVDFSKLMSIILNREKTGQLETIIAKISALFTQSPTYRLDECINETLKIVGEYAGVDRSYIFLFRENLKIMDNTHEWCAPGIEPQIENLQGLPTNIFPWWMKLLMRNEIIHIPKVSALPEEASAEKKILESQDIQSLIVVPMTKGENLIGFIGFDSVQRSKFWYPEDINLLKIVSSIFVSAFIRKNTELSLAYSERRYRTLFLLAPELLVILDEQGNILSLNPAFKKITGFDIDNFLKTPFSKLLPEEEKASFEKNLITCLRGNKPESREFKIKARHGQAILDLYLLPLLEKGKVVGIFGMGRDITERKALEKSLHQVERLKSIGTLAGGIAHDFNNILEILLTNYSIIKESVRENEEVSFSLQLVRQAIERGKNLVQNLLTFASKKEPKFITLDLNDEIKHVINLLQQTTPRSIFFDLKLAPQKIWLRFDQVQIQQMILNLCLNAIDAIKCHKPQGKIQISTHVMQNRPKPFKGNQDNPTGYCLLEIMDEGVGIDPETQKFLFDPFFTTKSHGTGLGLSVVYGIIERLHGEVIVDSTQGQGATFKILLPLAKREYLEKDEIIESSQKLITPAKGKPHILLVEDDQVLSKMFAFILKRYGYQVQQVYDGRKALRIIADDSKKIDIAILDFDIPEVNGWRIAKKILDTKKDIRVIISSGYLTPKIRHQIELEQRVKLFEKPFEPEDLLAYLTDVLNQPKEMV